MNPESRPYVGGQAVIEGVFMRAPRAVAIAVRVPDGSVRVKAEPYRPFLQRFRPLKWPFLRGAVVMIDALVVGMSALTWSAEQAAEAEREEASTARWWEKPAQNLTMLLSVVAGLALFVALPHYATDRLSWYTGFEMPVEGTVFHLVDGTIKLAIFLSYLLLIRRSADIKRVFEYHGAEHKTIYAWERKLPLTVETVRAQSRFHPRCGTSFLIGVVCVSILVFAAVFPFLPPLPIENRHLLSLAQIGIKVPLTIPIAAISYEILRFSARHYENPVCRGVAAPGLVLQRLTTEEPTDAQIEVAITALETALAEDALQGQPELGPEGEVFETGSTKGS